MALTRDALVVMYSHPGLTRKITNFLRGTGMKPKKKKTKKVIDTGYDARSPIRVLTPAKGLNFNERHMHVANKQVANFQISQR